jgi:hypothetical protein
MDDMAEIKRLIECLESDEGYFGMVQTISTEDNVPLTEAFTRVEDIREELGLKHRYTTTRSFYSARHRHHQRGGEIFRLQDDKE